LLLRSLSPLLLLAPVLLAGCGGADQGGTPLPESAPLAPVATSQQGMVVSGSALATRAGVEVLEAGGNAMDAAVATAFALAVVEPTQSGLGGRTQVVFRTAEGRNGGIDGATEAPAGYRSPESPLGEHGWGTVAIPGTVAALVRAVEEEGRLPLSSVMAPALRYAREGFPLPAPEAARLAGAAGDLAADPGARLHFLREDGSPREAGETWVQPVLAALLERIGGEGTAAFYTGGTAAAMARDIQGGGGAVTLADLEGYRTRDGLVVEGFYRDLQLVGTHLPASGTTTIQALQVLEHLDPAGGSEGEWAGAVGQALLLAFRDRDEVRHMEPEGAAQRLVSRARAAELAAEVRRPGESPPMGSGSPSPESGSAGVPSPGTAGLEDVESPFTTHVSVADGEGMVVALTQSLGPTGGARVASPELGFLYATTLGGYLGEVRPGERPFSSQSPLLVLREGRPVLVLGGAGARRIISAAVAVLSRWADGGMSIQEAMAAPRLHATPGLLTLEAMEGAPWPSATADELEAVGLRMETRPEGSWFARLNIIEVDSPRFIGIADHRWEGGGAGGPSLGAPPD
jgi:gamma-glutamyltranspeptidase / glutathione hydrolase